MAHLFILALSFVFISAGLIDREECCSEKTVGGVHYTLVEKTNTEVYNCLSNCVYIRTGDSGSRFCFAKGNQQVECADLVVGIMVVGGNDIGTSTELFLPGSGKSCKRAPLPHQRDVCTLDTVASDDSVADDFVIVCGSGPSAINSNPNNVRSTCLVLIPDKALALGGAWSNYDNLLVERTGHSSWVEPGGKNVLLMGGTPSFKTTELIGDGDTFSFNLKNPTIYACSIQLTDNVIITGGQFSLTDVTKYNTMGYVVDLPILTVGRFQHGCGSYQDGSILVVAGGLGSDKNILSSTMVHTIGSSTGWTLSKELPASGPLYAMASVSCDNVIYLIGGNTDSTLGVTRSTKQILKCTEENGEVMCSKLPQLQLLDARSFGAASKLMVDPTVCD